MLPSLCIDLIPQYFIHFAAQKLVLHEVVTEVVHSDFEEEFSPVVIFLVEDPVCTNMCLNARVPQDEVLNVHVFIDKVFQLIVLNCARAVLINDAEDLADVLSNALLEGSWEASQLGEPIDRGIEHLRQLSPVKGSTAINVEHVENEAYSLVILPILAEEDEGDEGLWDADVVAFLEELKERLRIVDHGRE